jgi:HlyD family secretion protein
VRGVAFALAAALALFGCGSDEERTWLGYVEGENALVAPPQPGWILSVAVARGSEVKVGDVLFTLDTTAQLAARANAASQLAAAEHAIGVAKAETERAAKEWARQRGLVRIGGTPKSAVEQAKAAYESAASQMSQLTAQADAARAVLAEAEWNLAERTVHARVAGEVQDIYFRTGEYAAAGAPVISILPPNRIYVRFFIPETALAHVRLGDTVHIGCDGCGSNLSARITFIATQSEFTPPIIYSVDNREKLVFRAEARDAALIHLRPGLPVTVAPLSSR